MTWHTTTVALAQLSTVLTNIRSLGGTIIKSTPSAGLVSLTWTVPSTVQG
jgi:hypothetical protein